jgi:hypothetical protein
MSLQHDPVEDTPEFKRVIEVAREEVTAQLLSEGFAIERIRASCHLYWPTLQEHLKAKYGIDWKTPIEMNPRVLFD